jgi:hypothetical protein
MVVSLMTMKGMATLATTMEGVVVAVYPVPALPTALDLEGVAEMMLTHATTLEGSDSDAAACPATMNSLKQTKSRTSAAWDNPTRPKTNAVKVQGMIEETFAYSIMLPPHPLLRPSHRRVFHVSPALL